MFRILFCLTCYFWNVFNPLMIYILLYFLLCCGICVMLLDVDFASCVWLSNWFHLRPVPVHLNPALAPGLCHFGVVTSCSGSLTSVIFLDQILDSLVSSSFGSICPESCVLDGPSGRRKFSFMVWLPRSRVSINWNRRSPTWLQDFSLCRSSCKLWHSRPNRSYLASTPWRTASFNYSGFRCAPRRKVWRARGAPRRQVWRTTWSSLVFSLSLCSLIFELQPLTSFIFK